MGLKTRLDGRSKDNKSFDIKDKNGEIVSTVTLSSEASAVLEVTTKEGLYIEKPNGWKSGVS